MIGPTRLGGPRDPRRMKKFGPDSRSPKPIFSAYADAPIHGRRQAFCIEVPMAHEKSGTDDRIAPTPSARSMITHCRQQPFTKRQPPQKAGTRKPQRITASRGMQGLPPRGFFPGIQPRSAPLASVAVCFLLSRLPYRTGTKNQTPPAGRNGPQIQKNTTRAIWQQCD